MPSPGGPESRRTPMSHATSLGWDLARPMVVVVAETDENDAETTRSADEVRAAPGALRPRVGAGRSGAGTPACPVAGFSQEVVDPPAGRPGRAEPTR